MKFSSSINRPPYESADGYLQVTQGCSHNRCLFCTYFKDQKFKKSSIEEIEDDIRQIPATFGAPKRIFLQGADGFSADYDTLMKTAELLKKYVPSVQSIGGYARIDSFLDKSKQQLENMKDAGFADPYIGVESGDDYVLKLMNKGYDAAMAREILEKLDISGMPYIVNFLNGAAGKRYGLKNAQETARLYSGLHPSMINMSMMTLVPTTPLYRLAQRGRYVQSSEKEKLEEAREFIVRLDNHTIFMNEHASNLFHVKCNLPDEKEALINFISELIESKDESKMQKYREIVANSF
ncbi:radical SAM protein [Campylobacter curvus]|uniref:Radical SAM superfamily enzyme, MoaA/NifB/PqqE/SkfB family n=1 Tax=Campylobacter curvus (strain 525.92) TaxID=360105 RepID=A0A0M3V1W9_CAMC5|nr:radical SAM protein [Campylobacter curvus]ALF45165.1 radical SAM superfamily enzyme, MoaA/NifB/PqqE/SkfB family [Campylobacter curvus 525.92]